jgi:hypothetical protein
MRSLVLALIVLFSLGGSAAEAGPWHHFHLNLGKRLVHRLRVATHRGHSHYHARHHHR